MVPVLDEFWILPERSLPHPLDKSNGCSGNEIVESSATVANRPVSLGIRSLVLYFSIASKDIQGVITVTNYFRTMSRR